MNGLSPNAAKNLNFFRDGKGSGGSNAGTDAVGYTWEWIEEKSSRSEEEILPPNPAIWETKPKENKDLDVYYEATGAIPILKPATRGNMLRVIPIGSTVEHEGSNAIPGGTTVYDVNPETQEIILSNNIQIDEADHGEIFLAWLQSFGWQPGQVPYTVSAGGGCFAGGQKVESKIRGIINIEDIETDEYVKTQSGWSRVYAWHMYTKNTSMEFVVVKHSNGELVLSDLHYIYVNNKPIVAKDIKVNDTIIHKGEEVTVTEVTTKVSKGIYNPYTINGKIIVNNINCSVYPVCHPTLQHILTRIALVITYFFPKERNKYYNMTPVESNSKQALQGMHKWVYILARMIGAVDKGKVDEELTIEELKNE